MEQAPTPTFLFEGTDIDKLHKEITKAIVEQGNDIVFGFEKKHARRTTMTIHIWGKAIKRLTNGSAPKDFVFNGKKLKEFRQQGIKDDPNPFEHVYTYQQLLREYPKMGAAPYNQLRRMKIALQNAVSSDVVDNGIVAVLYHPSMAYWEEKPCWNWIQVEYLGDGKIALRLLFRSHDYSSGIWANLSFILYMMRHFVAAPCNCEIVEVTLFSSNAHIYEGDQDNATKILGIPWLWEEHKGLIEYLRGWLK